MHTKLNFLTIVQARMSSKRLPGKVLFKIDAKNMCLDLLIKRIKLAKNVGEIVIATSSSPEDDIIERKLKGKCKIYRGNKYNVLKRIYNACQNSNRTNIIHLTGDNPLIDPEVIDFVSNYYLKAYPKYDFVTNNNLFQIKKNSFPIGMNVSVFKKEKLEKIFRKANKKDTKEHPTLYFYREGKKKFNIKNLGAPKKWCFNIKPRLTMDTNQDFKLIKIIYKILGSGLNLRNILQFLKEKPQLMNINKNIKQKDPKL